MSATEKEQKSIMAALLERGRKFVNVEEKKRFNREYYAGHGITGVVPDSTMKNMYTTLKKITENRRFAWLGNDKKFNKMFDRLVVIYSDKKDGKQSQKPKKDAPRAANLPKGTTGSETGNRRPGGHGKSRNTSNTVTSTAKKTSRAQKKKTYAKKKTNTMQNAPTVIAPPAAPIAPNIGNAQADVVNMARVIDTMERAINSNARSAELVNELTQNLQTCLAVLDRVISALARVANNNLTPRANNENDNPAIRRRN